MAERRINAEFVKAFETFLRNPSPTDVTLRGFHVVGVSWNQPPWSDLISSRQFRAYNSVFTDGFAASPLRFKRPVFFECVFRDSVHFSSCRLDNAEFVGCVFEGQTSFNGTEFIGFSNFADARFLGATEFDWAKISGKVWMRGGRSSRDGAENHVFYAATSLKRLEFDKDAAFELESAFLGNVSLLYTNIEKISMLNVMWDMGTRRKFWDRERRTIWDERQLTDASEIQIVDAVAATYRQLVLASERRREFEAAEDFHVGEMEIRLRKVAARWPTGLRWLGRHLSGVGLYRLSSLYGASYVRAALVLTTLVGAFALLFMLAGLREAQTVGTATTIDYDLFYSDNTVPAQFQDFFTDFGVALVHTLSILTFQRDKTLVPAGRLAELLQSGASVFLAGQAALLLFAIRRAFKR